MGNQTWAPSEIAYLHELVDRYGLYGHWHQIGHDMARKFGPIRPYDQMRLDLRYRQLRHKIDESRLVSEKPSPRMSALQALLGTSTLSRRSPVVTATVATTVSPIKLQGDKTSCHPLESFANVAIDSSQSDPNTRSKSVMDKTAPIKSDEMVTDQDSGADLNSDPAGVSHEHLPIRGSPVKQGALQDSKHESASDQKEVAAVDMNLITITDDRSLDNAMTDKDNAQLHNESTPLRDDSLRMAQDIVDRHRVPARAPATRASTVPNHPRPVRSRPRTRSVSEAIEQKPDLRSGPLISSPGLGPIRKGKPYTDEEKDHLIKLVSIYHNDWMAIAQNMHAQFPGKRPYTNHSVMIYYKRRCCPQSESETSSSPNPKSKPRVTKTTGPMNVVDNETTIKTDPAPNVKRRRLSIQSDGTASQKSDQGKLQSRTFKHSDDKSVFQQSSVGSDSAKSTRHQKRGHRALETSHGSAKIPIRSDTAAKTKQGVVSMQTESLAELKLESGRSSPQAVNSRPSPFKPAHCLVQ